MSSSKLAESASAKSNEIRLWRNLGRTVTFGTILVWVGIGYLLLGPLVYFSEVAANPRPLAIFLIVSGLAMVGILGAIRSYASRLLALNPRWIFGANSLRFFEGKDTLIATILYADITEIAFVKNKLAGASYIGLRLRDADLFYHNMPFALLRHSRGWVGSGYDILIPAFTSREPAQAVFERMKAHFDEYLSIPQVVASASEDTVAETGIHLLQPSRSADSIRQLPAIVLAALMVCCSCSYAQTLEKPRPDMQARSIVMTKLGIVATSQPLASRAGTQILENGGNAIDAAIAANAVLGLVEPTSNGIGGDLFAIVYEAKSGKLYGLNSSGWAPQKLTVEFLQDKGHKTMPEKGIHSVTVPGCVAGWEALRKRFGTQQFSTLLKPAIYYAEEGFPVTELIASGWRASSRSLAAHPNSKETYLPDGQAPKSGEVFRNPDLANSLKLIAYKGRDGYYKGRIAEAIVKISEEQGGTFELPDLEEFQPEWVEPLSTTYRGWTVYELPPNGQGIAALSMLNLLEQFPLAEYGHNSAKALHVMIEAKKLAYADMLHYVGDPKFAKVPVKEMLAKSLAEKRAKEIDPDKAHESAMPSIFDDFKRKAGNDTIYMCTVDKDGNMVSLIQSNYMGFGSGLVPPKCGFMLQNRGALFTLEKDHPNALKPRKRPLHTIIPAFMEKDDVRIAFGIMGGWNQAQAHAQYVANIVDFHLNLQAAMEAPRFTKMTFDGLDVKIESRIPEAVRADLGKRGHKVEMLAPYSGTVGGGQAVMRDAKGVNFGASDPRRDGCAIPEAPPLADKPKNAASPR